MIQYYVQDFLLLGGEFVSPHSVTITEVLGSVTVHLFVLEGSVPVRDSARPGHPCTTSYVSLPTIRHYDFASMNAVINRQKFCEKNLAAAWVAGRSQELEVNVATVP
jgi:hypothetical protein